jgi:hypothetical protein
VIANAGIGQKGKNILNLTDEEAITVHKINSLSPFD